MQYQTVKPGTFISPDDLEESELEFEEPDAPLVEKERPKMDALTHKLFIQNCRTEKSDVARDCSKGYADVGFRVVKVTFR